MAKVFTITEGIENLGALKTGGQGSVYKGKKTGEIITAIKLLPTPIHSEDANDKNYRDFQNEVKKLQRVNENPNPNVVSIIGFGITESGSLPYIEMEFIEGPDLGELLKPPHDPVFTIHEVIKVALHLSNALAHCHKCDVKHGDIKSNNVKYNQKTGNYILLDFGLALMSDEDRRTSLRHAGAIEFMAPEQNEGQMLFETDVYSFGVIIYELLAGIVPFPLHDSGETARNAVMVSHMETPPPDVQKLREESLPKDWDSEMAKMEMQIPSWLLSMLYKCLEKNADGRFEDGIQLHDYILSNTLATNKLLATESSEEDTKVQSQLLAYKTALSSKEQEINQLQAELAEKDSYISQLMNNPATPVAVSNTSYTSTGRNTVSKSSFITVLVIAAFLGAFAVYSLISNNNQTKGVSTNEVYNDSLPLTDNALANESNDEAREDNKQNGNTVTIPSQPIDSTKATNTSNEEIPTEEVKDSSTTNTTKPTTEESENADSEVRYKVNSKAFFHDKPDPKTRREAHIVHWNNAKLKSQGEANGFIYVVFTNHLGQTSRGWLKKSDLTPIKNNE